MKKRMIALGIIATMALSPVSYSQGDKVETEIEEVKEFRNGIKIEDKKLKGSSTELMRLETDVVIPKITGMSDYYMENKINTNIERDIEEEIKEFIRISENAYLGGDYKLNINYDVKSKEGILSIIFNKDVDVPRGVNIEPGTTYYNIDLETGNIMELDDVFKDDTDYLTKINEYIKKEIKENKDEYNANIINGKIIDKKQNFYMNEEGNIIIVFLEGEIAPRVNGEKKFNASKADIFNIIKEKFIRKEDIEIEVDNFENKVESEKDIIINIPQFSGFPNIEFENKLNEEVKKDMEKALMEFEEKSENLKTNIEGDVESDLSISYEIKSLGEIMSFVINKYELYAGDASGKTTKKFYNIDLRTYERLEFRDLFKSMSNHKVVLTDLIKSRIKEDKESYFQGRQGFQRIKDDENFFIDEYGNLIIEFPQYQIAPGSTGTPQFKFSSIELEDIMKEEILEVGLKYLDRIIIDDEVIYLDEEMHISAQGNVMIPLSFIEKEFDLDVKWDSENRIVNINNGDHKSGLSLDKNYYYSNKATVILSEKADSVEGRTYVPKDFIENILDSKTSLDRRGILNVIK